MARCNLDLRTPAHPRGRGHREPQVPGFRIRAQRDSKHAAAEAAICLFIAASAAAAAAAAAATAAAAERRLRGRAVHGEGGDLLQHVRGVARRARDHLVVAADELVEVILALHAGVFVDRHAPSVLSRRRGTLAHTDARGPDRAARAAGAEARRRPLGGVARPTGLALAADRPAADARRVAGAGWTTRSTASTTGSIWRSPRCSSRPGARSGRRGSWRCGPSTGASRSAGRG